MQPTADPSRPIDIPDRTTLTASSDRAAYASMGQQEAAANLVRGQIDSLFQENSTPPPATVSEPHSAATPPVATITPRPSVDSQPTEGTATIEPRRERLVIQPLSDTNVYAKSHTDSGQIAPEAQSLEQYHNAWQNYYQQYYERYYVGQVHEARQALEQHAPSPGTEAAPAISASGTITQDEALHDLRSQLRQRLAKTTQRVRGSRHFIPIASGFGVMLVFAFLQFNSVIFGAVAAYTSPGQIDQASIIIDPNASPTVGPEPKLIIPKINVDVPVDWNAKVDHDSQMAAMANGVAYFNLNGTRPGQVGNIPISGHSSNDFFEGGSYKFIFAKLDQLKAGDAIYLNYQGTRYTYSVTGSQVVSPKEVSALTQPTTKPLLTLITCTPLGTSLNRLLVTAEQVSPNPANASATPQGPSTTSGTAMPGTAPTLLERMFGAR